MSESSPLRSRIPAEWTEGTLNDMRAGLKELLGVLAEAGQVLGRPQDQIKMVQDAAGVDPLFDLAIAGYRSLRSESARLRASEEMTDSVRGVLQILRNKPGATFKDVLRHCELRGDRIADWPEWVLNAEGYVTEQGAAMMIYEIMARHTPSESEPVAAADAYKAALAQNLKLRKALQQCVAVAKAWHGDDAFDIYFNHSPEMKLIRDVLGKMP